MNLLSRTVPKVGWKRLVKPKQAQAPTCFLVYYDASLESLLALQEACEDAAPDTKIIAVYLDSVPYVDGAQRLSEYDPGSAGPILAAAVVNARTYGASVETLAVPCQARGPAMLRLAAQYPNATIYLGIEPDGPNPFADYIRTLLPARVILVAAAPEASES